MAATRSNATQRRAVDTRERLLDASERLFAEHGVETTSLRAIPSEASANLAAVHYHFGSKDAIISEVFARRIRPINALASITLSTSGCLALPSVENESIASRGTRPTKSLALSADTIAICASSCGPGSTTNAQSANTMTARSG